MSSASAFCAASERLADGVVGEAYDLATDPGEQRSLGREDAEWAALTRCLAPMIAALPAPYAEAVRRSDLDGETQRALADELGVSHSAIKSRVQRGRRMLRERLVACCNPIDGDGMDCAPDEPCS